MKTLIKKILREQTDNTVLVVFGGIDYATPEWMLKQIPETIKDSRTIIVKSHNSDIQEVIDELNEINYNTLEVVGFSAGGKRVFELAKKIEIHLLGLIDPSVPKDWKSGLDKFPPGEDSILFFDNSNWNAWKEIQGLQKDLKEAMEEKEMKVDEVDLNHDEFPKKFFDDYL